MSADLVADVARANLLVMKRGLHPDLAYQVGLCGAEARDAILESLEGATSAQIAALNDLHMDHILAGTLAGQAKDLRAAVWLLLADLYTALEGARERLYRFVRANSRQRQE